MYCKNITHYSRRSTYEVNVGEVSIGGGKPVVLQTMTSTATSDIDGTVEQIIRAIGAGAEIVRITVPAMRDLEYLRQIKEKLRNYAYTTPLVADIHFNQKIAFEAAKIVEKVRINPGNFADTKKFESIDYSEEDYNAELSRLKETFIPLLNICRVNNTALRIGTNHGSLSDRIMNRYGDTPEGMAESAMEFLRICKEQKFYNVVVSMKASNTLVMVQAMRLLVHRMDEENMQFPLHLGVTEAGEGEDGRIKSAVGIGALLADGIGDTIRVSLTEEPEVEIPVAKKLLNCFKGYKNHEPIEEIGKNPIDSFRFNRRITTGINNIGNALPPVVISDFSSKEDFGELSPDYVFIDKPELANDETKNYILISSENNSSAKKNVFPIISSKNISIATENGAFFFDLTDTDLTNELIGKLKEKRNLVIVLSTNNKNQTAALRAAILKLINADVRLPVILKREFNLSDLETLQITAAAELGALLLDGLCDGLWLANEGGIPTEELCNTSFGILQASRLRVSKPEYISCPSCGRTLFNIQDTTKLIRSKTAHLTGLKIGVMGCIVNGLGEMADADYGYIGGAPGKVNLYHHKDLIQRGVPEELAVDELVNLIKEKGDWIEP